MAGFHTWGRVGCWDRVLYFQGVFFKNGGVFFWRWIFFAAFFLGEWVRTQKGFWHSSWSLIQRRNLFVLLYNGSATLVSQSLYVYHAEKFCAVRIFFTWLLFALAHVQMLVSWSLFSSYYFWRMTKTVQLLSFVFSECFLLSQCSFKSIFSESYDVQ